MAMEWSKYQERIFDFVEKENGSAVVIAVAGSGKTTTIVEASKKVPADKRVAFVAFNKAIADELKARVPPHVKAQTLNGMGYSALINHTATRRYKLDTRKTSQIMDENMSGEDIGLYASGLKKLVGLAKAHGIVPVGIEGMGLTMDTEQNWADIIEKYDIEFECNAKPERGIELARNLLRESIQLAKYDRLIDFDDQLYLPVIWQANFFQYDVMFIDESQDVNQVQRAMIRMALAKEGRGIFVGDPYQSIYGFRGADTEAIENIKQEFSAVELPLSVSYRCPKLVVTEARKYVTHIEASELAPEGKVSILAQFNDSMFEATDGIICRLTAPMISLAYKLLRKGKACRVLGREIGQGLITLIKKMNAHSVDDLQERLDDYREREIRKLIAKGREERAQVIEDRVDSIKVFIEQLPETDRTVKKLVELITNLFTDNDKGLLTLCTIHKAKGLEWDRVFILNRELMPSKWARQVWQKQQESNITYVAITRAKKELAYIKLENWADNLVPEQEIKEEVAATVKE